MNIKLTYSRIKAADERCDEIVKELATLPPMEYCPEESRLKTRELNGEFIRSATFIVNQCQYVLNSDKFNDIDDLASLISACDQVVSTCNVIPPLAGSLGIKTNVLLAINSYWWWGIDQPRSYWFSSIRLFRQSNFGNWEDPLRELSEEIFSSSRMGLID